MRKKKDIQMMEQWLDTVRHDLKMRDFQMVLEPPVTVPLRFHVVAAADDLREEDIPSYIRVQNEIRVGLWECETDPDAVERAVREHRVCILSEDELHDFLDIVEEAVDGKVTTYEACDDGLAYRVSVNGSIPVIPDFVAVEEIDFPGQSFSAITAYDYALDTLAHWEERRDEYLGNNIPRDEGWEEFREKMGAMRRPEFSFPLPSKKNLPS